MYTKLDTVVSLHKSRHKYFARSGPLLQIMSHVLLSYRMPFKLKAILKHLFCYKI